jgi:hypothetical protein
MIDDDELVAGDAPEQDGDVNDESTQNAGPFGVGPVDPIVFSSDHDLPPELRPAATQIPMITRENSSPRLEAPKAPDFSPQPVWTPGNTFDDYNEPEQGLEPQGTSRVSSAVLSLLLALPLIIVGVVIWYAATHLVPN